MDRPVDELLRRIAPMLMFSFLLALGLFRFDLGAVRRRPAGRAYLALAFGLISAIGMVFSYAQ